ncbi:MAG: EamA family transporter [Desulfuromonas sp.]|nr:MAG: EamA family transporter [Desulfuromonas sp.]
MLTPQLKDRPYILLTMTVLFWAGNFILGRAFHADIPPIALAFWRWAGASLLVALPASRYLRDDWPEIRRCWPAVLLLSFLGIACFNTLAYSGLQYTQAINAFLIQSLMPVLIVVFSLLIFKERVAPVQVVGIAVSLAGAVTIIARGEVGLILNLEFNRGDLLVLLAIVCYAGYSSLLRLRPKVHPLSFIAVTFWLGTAILMPLYLWEHNYVRPLHPVPTTFLVLAYVAIFPSIVSYLCFNRGVELVGANRAGLFIHLMPVFGSLMAMVFLGEQFYWFHALGIGLIAVGICLATRAGRT